MTQAIKILTFVTLFSIAMAFIESAVVVYLREIFYPNGFVFPLAKISLKIGIIEVIREFCTLVMLLTIGWLAGTRFITRFAWFIYCFAIWDIFFYVFLKTTIGWPESLLTWDILFLIPTTWTGPVIAPVLVSFTMILLAFVIIYFDIREAPVSINKYEWILIIAGSIVLIVSFVWDYSKFLFSKFSFIQVLKNFSSPEVTEIAIQYVPDKFNWVLFLSGEGIILLGIILIYFRFKKFRIRKLINL